MTADMIRAFFAAAAVAVLPGYFWAVLLRPATGLGERLAYSTALSMGSVPTIAIVIARAAGTGIAMWVVLASVAVVFGSGAAVFVLKGQPAGSSAAVLPRPGAPRDARLLAVVAVAFGLALAVMLELRVPGWLYGVTAAAVVIAGALVAWPAPATPPVIAPEAMTMPITVIRPGMARPPGVPPAGAGPMTERAASAVSAPAGKPAAGGGTAAGPGQAAPSRRLRALWSDGTAHGWLREGALAAVLVLTAARVYDGVIRHDWPFLRGGDQFSHAVMAEQMLSHGAYRSYLVYPPGFPALTAVICRIANLSPLALFPVLAPVLLVVSALAAYALATRLWGWGYGIAAAALNGLVLSGAFAGFAEGRYPDLVSAYFLLVMTVAALVTLYASPTFRSGVLVTIVASSVVLYHSVATLYLAVLLAAVVIIGLPYLVFAGRRREARALLLTLATVAVVSAGYAAYIYNLPNALGGHGSSSTAVSIVLGSQSPPGPRHVLTELAPPVVWLGLFGVALLVVGLRHLARPPQALAVVTVLLWCLLMYVGSRTKLDGFPQRFERDLGAPLSVTGGLGLGLIVRSVAQWRPGRPVLALTAAAAAIVAVATVGVQAVRNIHADARPGQEILTAPVAAAGEWLAAHNTGGNIISTPYMNPGISNRAVLAMGGYTGLQSYTPRRIAHPRSLPTAGRKPLLDSREVLLHPATCQAASILVHDDVRYVVLYRFGSGADLAAFKASRSRYHLVFQNSSVIIYDAAHVLCQGG